MDAHSEAVIETMVGDDATAAQAAIAREWSLEVLGKAWQIANQRGDQLRCGAISSRMDRIRGS